MDIHKPKAAKSWREFLIEIGTITVGILIALGLEAALEAYRNHELVERTSADLRRELSGNRKALAEMLAEERTVLPALAILSRYGRDRLAGKPAALSQNFTLSMGFQPLNTAAWDSAVATQALPHMPSTTAQALARAYAGTRAFGQYETDATRHWLELSTLPDDPQNLSDAELKGVMREVALNAAYLDSLQRAGSGLLAIYDKTLAELR